MQFGRVCVCDIKYLEKRRVGETERESFCCHFSGPCWRDVWLSQRQLKIVQPEPELPALKCRQEELSNKKKMKDREAKLSLPNEEREEGGVAAAASCLSYPVYI